MALLHGAFLRSAAPIVPDPAAFDAPPAAISPRAASLRAREARAAAGKVLYSFREVAGGPGATGSGWQESPAWIAGGLRPDSRYAYAVRVRDSFGNVTEPSQPAEVRTDRSLFRELEDTFDSDRDLLAGGTGGTVWEGALADPAAPSASIAVGGSVLRLESKGTYWDGRKPLGLLLHRTVEGDFVAEARIADAAGLAEKRTPLNNDGGIMARAADPAAAGPGEDLLQLSFFPIYGVGNMWTSLDGGGRPQSGNRLGWEAHRWLQMERRGDAFHFRTSADGERWTELPGSPVLREDLRGLPLQVGPFHAMYSDAAGWISYDLFRITVRD